MIMIFSIKDHYHVATCLHNLARCDIALEDYDSAAKNLEKGKKIYQEHFKKRPEQLGYPLHISGNLKVAKKDIDGGIKDLLLAKQYFEKMYGKLNVDVAVVCKDLSLAYKDLDKKSELKYLREAHKIFNKVYTDKTHPYSAYCERRLKELDPDSILLSSSSINLTRNNTHEKPINAGSRSPKQIHRTTSQPIKPLTPKVSIPDKYSSAPNSPNSTMSPSPPLADHAPLSEDVNKNGYFHLESYYPRQGSIVHQQNYDGMAWKLIELLENDRKNMWKLIEMQENDRKIIWKLIEMLEADRKPVVD